MKLEDAPEATYEQWGYDNVVEVWFAGEPDENYRKAIDEGVEKLKAVFGDKIPPVLQELKIIVADDLIEGAAEAFPEEKKIILNKAKNKMSLKEAEEFVIAQTDFEIELGDMSKFIENPNEPYSSAVINIVHESGHIIDKLSEGNAYNRLDPSLSPTKYGRLRGSHEAFAEAFTFYVFGKEIKPEAKQIVETTIDQNWGEL